MEWMSDPGYWCSRWLFQRTFALVYLVAFVVALNQFRALAGTRGLTPAPRYLATHSWRRAPSIFQWHYSDRCFGVVAWTGIALSALALAGGTDLVPEPVAMLVWAALWVLYLSIVNIGQAWYSFGWESLLLEIGFLAIFLGNGDTAPPILMLLLLRWIVFRLEFGAGLIKMRGDRCWRDLTCLYYHHQTQPLPGPLSWYFHHLPRPLHRVEVAANHVAQLVVPFLLFLPQPIAGVAAAIVAITQLWLVVSGNFSWLNALTIVLALSVLPGWWFPVSGPDTTPLPMWHNVLQLIVGAGVVLLSYAPVRNLLSSKQLMNASFSPLHLVNTYGAFGSITRTRYEIIVEGSRDGTRWHAYEFKAKPGDLRRRPPQIAPYHLRLDWLMWFAAISPAYAKSWFAPFVAKLLDGDAATLKLLRSNPFPDAPPVYVRAELYEYRFTDRRERRATGCWWAREHVGQFLPPVHKAS